MCNAVDDDENDEKGEVEENEDVESGSNGALAKDITLVNRAAVVIDEILALLRLGEGVVLCLVASGVTPPWRLKVTPSEQS